MAKVLAVCVLLATLGQSKAAITYTSPAKDECGCETTWANRQFWQNGMCRKKAWNNLWTSHREKRFCRGWNPLDDCGCIPGTGWDRNRNTCRSGSSSDNDEKKTCLNLKCTGSCPTLKQLATGPLKNSNSEVSGACFADDGKLFMVQRDNTNTYTETLEFNMWSSGTIGYVAKRRQDGNDDPEACVFVGNAFYTTNGVGVKINKWNGPRDPRPDNTWSRFVTKEGSSTGIRQMEGLANCGGRWFIGSRDGGGIFKSTTNDLSNTKWELFSKTEVRDLECINNQLVGLRPHRVGSTDVWRTNLIAFNPWTHAVLWERGLDIKTYIKRNVVHRRAPEALAFKNNMLFVAGEGYDDSWFYTFKWN